MQKGITTTVMELGESLMCESARIVDFLYHTLLSVSLSFLLSVVVINLLVWSFSLHVRLRCLEILRFSFTSSFYFFFMREYKNTNHDFYGRIQTMWFDKITKTQYFGLLLWIHR